MKTLIASACLFASTSAQAQISDGGLAPSLDRSLNLSLTQPPVHSLARVDVQQYLAEDAVNNATKDVPFRFGAEIAVSIDAAVDGVWDQLPDGSWLWRVEIRSPDAYSLNLIFDRFVVPPGGRLYLHSPTTGDHLGAFTDFNMSADEVLGTMLTSGESVVVEYHEPAAVAFPADLRIGTVVHGYRDILAKSGDKAFGDSGSCNNNVACSIAAGWEGPIASTVMLVDGGAFCSGALVNNTAQDQTPYVLTADHCGGGESSWVFVFNWESATCSNPGSAPPQNDTVSGAVVRANRSASDFRLVETNNAIPLSYNPFFAGWDYSGIPTTDTVGIHHPSGDIKKFSIDADPPLVSGYYGAGNDHWRVDDWDDGTTEGGSSGSPLFDANQRIIGQLHGGNAACGNNLEDYYGAFHVSWDAGSSSSSRLVDWLDPLGLDPGLLDGFDPNASSLALDARAQAILDPLDNSQTCNDPAPLIRIQNVGSDPLTSVDIEVQVDGGGWALDQQWTGNLAQNGTADVVLATIPLSSGLHTLEVRTNAPNGSLDENTANDATAADVTKLDATGIAPPVFDDFEAALFPGVGWVVDNPDGNEAWGRTTQASGYGIGSGSARFDNYTDDFRPEQDALITPLVDLAGMSSAEVAFDHAYARYNSTYADRLMVLATGDCGGTWDVLFDESSSTLSTTGSNAGSFFVPAGGQWATNNLDLTAYVGGTVQVAFVNETGWGNNLYLDNIGLDGVGNADFDFDGDCSCASGPCSGSANPSCGALVPGDCDDGDPNISPLAAEISCDTLDNDCNPGTVDSPDGDGDGDGVCTDCNDADPGVASTLSEIACDGIDNDCDPGTIDSPDGDGDGDGACTDCDDTDPGRASTFAETTCDGIDNDCDIATVDAPDADGDGDPVCSDCNDADPGVASTLPEISCDGIDNDCSVVTPDGLDVDGDGYDECVDCDDTQASVNPGAAEQACNGTDDDCDPATTDTPDGDGDGVGLCAGDCDDGDSSVFPGAAEATCDGVDNDCDPGTSDTPDGDGDGDPVCTDCDDADPAVASTLAEATCDGIDNDCDPGTSDTPDADGDGDPACTDCDDTDPAVASTLAEVTCDGLDNDCDAATLDAPDGDGDGDDVCIDCDDADPTVGPSAAEVTCDGIDNDCDAGTSDAPDGDGDGDPVCTDCDDTDATVASTLAEVTCDGLDNDCDPATLDGPDADGDGDPVCTDCDDTDPTVASTLAEVSCDGVDNDCDPATLDDGDGDGDGIGACSDCDDANASVFPGAAEICDGLDSDCDGVVPTLEADADGDGLSVCAGDCDDADANTYPGAVELCDTADNDCDGTIPSDEIDTDGDGFAACALDCDDSDPNRYPGAPEVCDAIDNDCDGILPLDELDEDLDGVPTCAGDCDDAEAAMSPDLPENTQIECTDGLDNDCDGLLDLDDPDCAAWAGTGTGSGTGTSTGTSTGTTTGGTTTGGTTTGGTTTGTTPGTTGETPVQPTGDGEGESKGGCGCEGAPTSPTAPLMLLGLGLVGLRRRQR